MITNYTAYKYETPYKVHFLLKQCVFNSTVNLRCGMVQMKYNIRRINPYKYDTKVDGFSSNNMSDDVNILVTRYILLS